VLVTTVAMALHWMLFAVAGLMGLSAWLVYLWAVRDGQFKDIEEPARRMLANDLQDEPR
jgi:cbb3-type cytochrome oxidase maturation protein